MVLIDPDSCDNATRDVEASSSKYNKPPKRVLHFSDGTLEEYSTDEEEVDTADKNQTVVDPSTLNWGPWFWYKTWAAGNSTLSMMDTAGEFLASVFGITTPRYYFELEEYKRREEQTKNRKEQEIGWSEPSTAVPLAKVSTKQPEPVDV